jgi:hypothetical protein
MQNVHITLRQEKGVERLVLPLKQETTHGFTCFTGEQESPATEWFPKQSKHCTATLIKEN